MRRHGLATAVVLSVLSLCGQPALAQNYPDKPVRLLLGNPPGGTTDIAARVLAEKMRDVLGQSFIVENRVGAGTQIATQAVSAARPDGYTLLYATAGVVTGPTLMKAWTIDGTKHLTPISQVAIGVNMVGAHPKQPYNTIDEWIAYMKANPGKLNYANISATDLVSFEMIKGAANVKYETVRFNGAVPAQNAVIAGQADFYAAPVGSLTRSLVQAGQIKLLGILATERSPMMPQVPSFGESALPELRELAKFSGLGHYWFGLAGPKGLPRGIVDVVHGAASKLLTDADYVKRVGDLGLVASATTPEAFTDLIIAERSRFAVEAKKAGVEPQ